MSYEREIIWGLFTSNRVRLEHTFIAFFPFSASPLLIRQRSQMHGSQHYSGSDDYFCHVDLNYS